MKQLIKQKLDKALSNNNHKELVDIVVINTPIVEVMKKVNIFWPEAHRNTKLMGELAIASNEANKFNAVNVPFDMVVESEALGCEVVWSKDIASTPQVKRVAFNDIDNIKIDSSILDKGRFKIVLDAISYIKENYRRDIPIIPFVDGPFTIWAHCIGINKLFKLVIKNKTGAKKIFELFNSLCIDYANAQIERGADFIMMLDPIVSGLSGKIFKDLIVPVYKEFNRNINKKAILHICGNVNRILECIPLCDFTAFSFDQPAMKIESLKSKIGNKIKIIGAIPTIDSLLEGSSKDVFNKTIECINKGIDIVAPSCCIPPEVKLENLIAIKDAIKYYNNKLRKKSKVKFE